jgi:hypothetical protein
MQREVGCRFLCLQALNSQKMKQNIETQANGLQVVKVNNHLFAVELVTGNVHANLTQMAKPYGRTKRPASWLRTDAAKSYIERLSVAHICATADLMEVRQGGNNQGTWCNDFRAIMRFAQWIDDDFAIAVDTLLVKLLTGQATVAEPFNGVEPAIYKGKPYYNYRDVLESLGYSRNLELLRQMMPDYDTALKLLYEKNM